MRRVMYLLLCLSMACKSGGQPAQEDALTLVMTDAYGGAEEAGLQVFRDEKNLKQFFARVNRSRKPGLPLPQVDFTTHIALVYCSGKTTDTILPKLYTHGEDEAKIILGKKTPKMLKDTTLTALRLPFALYILPRTEKEIILE